MECLPRGAPASSVAFPGQPRLRGRHTVGRFHADTVAGGFVTADVRGTGLRGEVAFTDSGDAARWQAHPPPPSRSQAGVMNQPMAGMTTIAPKQEARWQGRNALGPDTRRVEAAV